MIEILQKFPLELTTFFLLAFALLSFWISENKKISLSIFIISVFSGLFSGVIEYGSLLSMSVLGIFTFLFYKKEKQALALQIFLFVSIVIITLLMFAHKMPGYNNLQLYPDIKLSENSPSFPLWLNFDKPLIGFFILMFSQKIAILNSKKYKEIFVQSLPFFGALSLLLIFTGVISNYIIFDPKLPNLPLIIFWVIKMLLFTILAEELLFRVLIQDNVIRTLGKFRHKNIIGLVISSFLFGLLHAPGGITFVILAFFAGLFYGGIYLKTKRIESAILVHFLVNFLHFFLFSYPHYSKIAS